MGRSQRDKEQRAERELAHLLGGERVPLSGASGGSFTGNVKTLGLTWEVKIRGNGFKELYKWLCPGDSGRSERLAGSPHPGDIPEIFA